MRALRKTTIVIWSEAEVPEDASIEFLARDATSGDSYCSKQETKIVNDPQKDPDWDGTEFFTDVY